MRQKLIFKSHLASLCIRDLGQLEKGLTQEHVRHVTSYVTCCKTSLPLAGKMQNIHLRLYTDFVAKSRSSCSLSLLSAKTVRNLQQPLVICCKTGLTRGWSETSNIDI